MTTSTTSPSGFTAGTFSGTWTFRILVAPPRPVQRCFHVIFDLPCSASKAELRSAYRRLAKIAHPDLNPEMGRWMAVLNRVYEMLEKAA